MLESVYSILWDRNVKKSKDEYIAQQVLEVVDSEAKCKVCFADAIDPKNRLLCKNGHKIEMSPEFSQYLSHFFKPCMYFQHGCQEKMKILDLQSHERDCDYRQIFCPINGCKESPICDFL